MWTASKKNSRKKLMEIKDGKNYIDEVKELIREYTGEKTNKMSAFSVAET